MIDIYLTDIIRIITVNFDEWGGISETESSDIAARVEDFNKNINNQNGQEVMGNLLIMMKYDNTINYNSKIKVKKKNGIDYSNPDKSWAVISLSKLGMFGLTHYEVII